MPIPVMTATQTKKNKYRATFILDTRSTESPVETLIEGLAEAITSVGGETERVENLGRQDFVRITEKSHTGDFYVRIYFESPPSAIGQFQENLRLEKTVKRIFVEGCS